MWGSNGSSYFSQWGHIQHLLEIAYWRSQQGEGEATSQPGHSRVIGSISWIPGDRRGACRKLLLQFRVCLLLRKPRVWTRHALPPLLFVRRRSSSVFSVSDSKRCEHVGWTLSHHTRFLHAVNIFAVKSLISLCGMIVPLACCWEDLAWTDLAWAGHRCLQLAYKWILPWLAAL